MPDAPLIPLTQIVQVRQNGLRSINIEQDIDKATLGSGYTLTPQARSTLSRMLARFIEPGTPSRAWTLTGPYGSGKSYFSLFLMNLLCAHLPAHQPLTEQLAQVDPVLRQQIESYAQFSDSQGFLPIPITGYRASLQECLWHGIGRALAPLLENRAIFAWYKDLGEMITTASSRQIITQLQGLGEIVCTPDLGYRGILFLLDEMGKPLEYLANHPESGDIYLLQEIAEFADRSQTPMIFIGILHQGFERYAGHLDMTTQREWAKVQGRFADIAFQEPPHQQMALLAHTLVKSGEPVFLKEIITNYAKDALENGWKPPLVSGDEFRLLSQQAYPLHPTTLVALPHLFRRLAQNERSLFSYLGSLEPFGFQEFLQTHRVPDVVRLYDLFDYLVANFQGRLYASMRGRLITETLERLQTAPHLSPLEMNVLKTIGLVNWLAEVSDLQSSKRTVMAALRTAEINDTDIEAAIEQLLAQSFIVFRRFNSSYVVWQGSDVDLDERMQAAQRKLQGVFRLAHSVEQYMPPRPIVARRHSYRTGFMRFWQMRYVDVPGRETIQRTADPGFAGTVFLALPITKADYDSFTAWSLNDSWQKSPDVLIGVAQETTRMAQLAQELRGLHWVRENTPELRDDPVARRELRTRINAIEMLIHTEIEQTLSPHRLSKGSYCRWFYQGEEWTERFGRGLSHLLSTISDALYVGSPHLWNELINRQVLSSQGAAARRNLIEAMWLHGDKPHLGISGYPPERSMYESVLVASGLHQKTENGDWGFALSPTNDPLNLRPVWEALENWVFAGEPQQRSVAELFLTLSVPPYGLTDGLLPVLLCAFMLTNRHEITLYREGSLLPAPGIADWEVLLRRPELFAVAGVRVIGPRAAIIKRMAQSLETESAALPVVRELIRRISTLPEYARRTQQLSARALALRQAFDQARMPERLLFHDLPLSLGLPSFAADEEVKPEYLDQFFDRLNTALSELTLALPQLIASARDAFLGAFGFVSGEAGWQAFRAEAVLLQPYIHQPNLIPLLKRAAEMTDSMAALESVLAYVANRPPRSWTDVDIARYHAQVIQLGQLFQNERGVYDPTAALSAEQRQQSRELVETLHRYIPEGFRDDPEIIRAALRTMLKELDTRFSTNGYKTTDV